jgi:hypothetical protein
MILDSFIKHRTETMDHPTQGIYETAWAKLSARYSLRTGRSLEDDVKNAPKTTEELLTQLERQKGTFDNFRLTSRPKYDSLKKNIRIVDRLCVPAGSAASWMAPFGRSTFGLIGHILKSFDELSLQYDTIEQLLDVTVVREFSSSLAYWC